MGESSLYAEILSAYSHGDTRLFRTNSALAWQGKVIEHTPTLLVLAHPRAIRFGAPGMSDLTGWSAGGIYTAIECKVGRRKPTDEQAAFIELVRRSGGRAGVARSVEEAGMIIRGDV